MSKKYDPEAFDLATFFLKVAKRIKKEDKKHGKDRERSNR